jgi:hypothetical protein
MAQYQSGQRKGVGFFGWIKRLFLLALLAALGAGGYWFYQRQQEVEVLKQVVGRLTAEERVAEVLVEDYQKDPTGKAPRIKLKILEFDTAGQPLKPVYCTFSANDVIHFEALVIRLDERLVMEGQGKSVYLFRRAFALDEHGNTYESCDINRPNEIPGGYSLGSADPKVAEVEQRFWKSFWVFALDEKRRQEAGIRNAQLEAPATRFVPDMIYKLYLEHDGGLHIDASPVPAILKGQHGGREVPAP